MISLGFRCLQFRTKLIFPLHYTVGKFSVYNNNPKARLCNYKTCSVHYTPVSYVNMGETFREVEDPCEGDSLVQAAIKVLCSSSPDDKARRTLLAVDLWRSGNMVPCHDQEYEPPLKPARDNTVKVVPPHEMPRLGKGGTIESRRAIIHSLVHIESWAIDLSWDIIARFGPKYKMPREFYDDFVVVAEDENRHHLLLKERLIECGSTYGEFNAHDALWESAHTTKDDLLARLAVEHCVHEARGLDVLPTTIKKFENQHDTKTASLLSDIIYPEEITHVTIGLRWFHWLIERHNENVRNNLVQDVVIDQNKQAETIDPIKKFHEMVSQNFNGPLKPPFNVQARETAGFTPEYYEPLVNIQKMKMKKLRKEREEELERATSAV